MTGIIENYLNNLTIEQTNELALKNDIKLNIDELNFLYSFLKTNALSAVNQRNFDIEPYRTKFSPENFNKIKELVDKYSSYI